MPQQINLCTPVLMVEKRYFSARTMLQALALLVLVGGAIAGYGVWAWNSAAREMRAMQAAHQSELASLRVAIVRTHGTTDADMVALNKQLQEQGDRLEARQRVLAELRRGLFAPGSGHSARLALVARSIPAQAWVTDMQAEEARLEVRGFTLEPASLNAWIARLGESPLLEGQHLGTVRVERVGATGRDGLRANAVSAPGPAIAPGAGMPPVWAFTLATAAPGASLLVPKP